MKLWEQNIRVVEPYVPGEQPKYADMIKLNTNENPYPPAKGVMKACKEFQTDVLRLYPDPTVSNLVETLADYYHLKKEQVFVGVGSDDVLATAFLTFFNSDKPILFPDITYSFYDVWANLYRIPFKQPALEDNFRIRKEDYYEANGGVVIANPNAPTALYEDLDFIEDIIKHNQDVIVIVDEAYIDYAGRSAVELLDKYENLVVVQTFSKSRSMAGIRIGYCMANERLIKAMNDVKYSINSYTMNTPSIALGVEAVKDDAYFKEKIKQVVATRERVKQELSKLGFEFGDSKANFIFATHKQKNAKDIFEALKAEHIFVRYFNKPRINNYLRISMGTDEQMDTFLEKLKDILSK